MIDDTAPLQAACHCGTVRFRVKLTDGFRSARRCTCSFCRMRGAIAVSARLEDLHFLQGEANLTLYQFNKKIAKHFFCKHCGIHTFGNPRSNPDSYLVNVRCLDDFDLETANYEVKPFDGRNWEAAYQARLAGR